jgi:hypothetical protein
MLFAQVEPLHTHMIFCDRSIRFGQGGDTVPEKKSLVQRVTQIFVGGPKKPEPAHVAEQEKKPTETDAQREQRLAAYLKLCEQEAQNAPQIGAKKKIKYRAADFNGSGQHPKVKTD